LPALSVNDPDEKGGPGGISVFAHPASWVPQSFRGAQRANPEPRDSGFDAAHRPGM